MFAARQSQLVSHLARQLHLARAAPQAASVATLPHPASAAAHGSQAAKQTCDSHAQEAAHAPNAAQPPADWYKRGQWVDPAQVMQRMTDEEPAQHVEQEAETVVGKHLSAMIKYRGGPVTVAEYMREVLAHPAGGVYTAHGADAIGRQGHFVTSPEISALFGETIAAWLLQHYQELLGSPQKVALVELGPGKGTLMKQILAALGMMQGGSALLKASTVHLVEVSPPLRQQQFDALQCSHAVLHAQLTQERAASAPRKPRIVGSTRPETPKAPPSIIVEPQPPARPPAPPVDTDENVSEGVLRLGSAAAAPWQDGLRDVPTAGQGPADAVARADCAMTGGQVQWHSSLAEVPQDVPCIIIGHEFLDALPVHAFRKDADRGWLEVLVDEPVDMPESGRRFDYVLSPRGTRASASILPRRLDALRKPERAALHAIEVGAEAMAVAEEAALRITRSGGFGLFIDYGQDGPYESSLNAIRHHEAVHPLQEPGSADVTAWVDFAALRQAVKARKVPVKSVGPIQQGHFLLANGMEDRVDALLAKPGRTEDEAAALEEGLARLCAGTRHHAQGMGETYKVMALVPVSSATPFPFDLDFAKLQQPEE